MDGRKSQSRGELPLSAAALVKRIAQRRRLDRVLDWMRFRIDTFPQSGPVAKLSCVSYQPLPWAGIDGGRRAEGTRSRFAKISETIERLGNVRSTMDIGGNSGFFVISLAERGIPGVVVESNPVAYRTALYGIGAAGVASLATVMTLEVNPENVELLPVVDATILLSIWHHFVRAYGLDQATDLLKSIWKHTNRVLFFDTGENEMGPDFRLPKMEPDGKTWLEQYLAETCEGATVEHLGLHDAFGPDLAPVQRNLFAVVRA